MSNRQQAIGNPDPWIILVNCLLPVACCLLPIVRCQLPIAYYLRRYANHQLGRDNFLFICRYHCNTGFLLHLVF